MTRCIAQLFFKFYLVMVGQMKDCDLNKPKFKHWKIAIHKTVTLKIAENDKTDPENIVLILQKLTETLPRAAIEFTHSTNISDNTPS